MLQMQQTYLGSVLVLFHNGELRQLIFEIGITEDVLPFGCYICTSTYKTKGVSRFFISISKGSRRPTIRIELIRLTLFLYAHCI